MNRRRQQAELVYKVGLLLAPLQDIVDNPESHDKNSRARAAAKYFADLPKVENAIREFTENEPGHKYETEWVDINWGFIGLLTSIKDEIDNPKTFKTLLEEKSSEIINGILAIPVPESAPILEAHTPFSTYCFIKDMCQTVAEQIIWIDRYLDASLFYRYLHDVPTTVKVTLVMSSQEIDSQFKDISKLFADERGPDNYRLVVQDDFHDRWLICDERMYVLGGSVKHAGQKSDFTIANLEATAENIDRKEQLLKTGVEIFGPSEPNHP